MGKSDNEGFWNMLIAFRELMAKGRALEKRIDAKDMPTANDIAELARVAEGFVNVALKLEEFDAMIRAEELTQEKQ